MATSGEKGGGEREEVVRRGVWACCLNSTNIFSVFLFFFVVFFWGKGVTKSSLEIYAVRVMSSRATRWQNGMGTRDAESLPDIE